MYDPPAYIWAITIATNGAGYCRGGNPGSRCPVKHSAQGEGSAARTAWPGPDQRALVVLASQLMAADLRQQGHPPAGLYAGRGHCPRPGRRTQANRACSGHRHGIPMTRK